MKGISIEYIKEMWICTEFYSFRKDFDHRPHITHYRFFVSQRQFSSK